MAHQLASTAHVYAFHRWRRAAMAHQNLHPPCTQDLDDEGRAIVQEELDNIGPALSLVESDSRLGFHQECQAYLYDGPRMRAKIKEMVNILDST